MSFTGQQEQALQKIEQWLGGGEFGSGAPSQIFRLFGYAGTGKTTIAQNVAAGHVVRFAAPTGKAATVMRAKGCAGAQTIHSMIYRTRANSEEWLNTLEREFAREQATTPQNTERLRTLSHQIKRARDGLKGPSFSLNEEAFVGGKPDLICIDECSMIDQKMGLDLLSFKVPILVIGDPAQLPPVQGAGYFTAAQPDVLLTEIHRQAEGNPILDLATIVRNGHFPSSGAYGASFVGRRGGLKAEAYEQADQILVGLNKTRREWNRAMRERLGYQGLLPMEGERVVCLRNNGENGLMNGMTFTVDHVDDCPKQDTFSITVSDGAGFTVETEAHKSHFFGQELDWRERQGADEFDFAYAMTVHKYQGSQANNVIVLDEWPIDATRQQWRYTGITRAAERVAVVS